MKYNWNENWFFTKRKELNIDQWEPVSLPHTWNGQDGQDGGSDYYRGICYYTKKFNRSKLQERDGYQKRLKFW